MIAAPAPALDGVSARSIWRHRADGVTPIERLIGTLENLTLIQSALESGDRRQTEDLTSDLFAQVFTDAREVCREFDLETARVRADFALAAFESGRLDKLGSETAELVRHIRHDVESCSVYPLPHDRLWGFKFSASEKAAAAFPLAQAEVAEGGRCFTLGHYNATVFQMMRAAYHGVHALAAAVDSKRAVAAGAVDWSALANHVEARVAAVDKWRTDEERAAAHAFLSDALRDVRGLHECAKQLADPGHVFDETRALTVCHTTRDFIDRLARRITEAQARPLTRVDFAVPGAELAARDNLRSMPRARRVVTGADRMAIAADRPESRVPGTDVTEGHE
ncbi:MAG TPA: hypothetical protein VNJ02_07285 [Vicinamibacterales bacterium]|nr:hypothetical protein [Vicinamibacterales bacterium]